jgi:hypothetical protein
VRSKQSDEERGRLGGYFLVLAIKTWLLPSVQANDLSWSLSTMKCSLLHFKRGNQQQRDTHAQQRLRPPSKIEGLLVPCIWKKVEHTLSIAKTHAIHDSNMHDSNIRISLALCAALQGRVAAGASLLGGGHATDARLREPDIPRNPSLQNQTVQWRDQAPPSDTGFSGEGKSHEKSPGCPPEGAGPCPAQRREQGWPKPDHFLGF